MVVWVGHRWSSRWTACRNIKQGLRLQRSADQPPVRLVHRATGNDTLSFARSRFSPPIPTRAPSAVTATAMVVMELGGEWPAHIDDLTRVVGLSPCGEDILQRTQEKLCALGRKGEGIRVAVLACNAATDADAVVRRAKLARALLGAVRHTVHGRLILSAREGASIASRTELLSLAGQLTDALRGTTASVHLWFTEPSRGDRAPIEGRAQLPEARPVVAGRHPLTAPQALSSNAPRRAMH
jgi:hypothetical protein